MYSSRSKPLLETLPNEILTSVFKHFPSKDLPLVALVNRRLHSLIIDEINRRVNSVASLPHNDIILECYHPTNRLSTPYLACRYLGTKSKSNRVSDLYSSFRPVIADEERGHPRRGVGRSSNWSEQDGAMEHTNLEDGVLFSQLCTIVNLVKTGPKPGLFVSHVNMTDSILRVWRIWMAEMADRRADDHPESLDDPAILWLGNRNDIGIRFTVHPGPMARMPVISAPEDLPPISYKLYFKELLVRTTSLLLAVEESSVLEVANSGKAIMIVSSDVSERPWLL